jgi:hypothetical protein
MLPDLPPAAGPGDLQREVRQSLASTCSDYPQVSPVLMGSYQQQHGLGDLRAAFMRKASAAYQQRPLIDGYTAMGLRGTDFT